MDCYEVVRELVEDGIVKAGATVSGGGLITALRAMCGATSGASICISDICQAHSNELPIRVLFAEVPGVIIQIADIDYDYVDAELLLQDVVFFPLGHPDISTSGIVFTEKTDLPHILESLMSSMEGED
jgi:phosphoribosylformylglycinamidine (FGAM) synthase-like enzyme